MERVRKILTTHILQIQPGRARNPDAGDLIRFDVKGAGFVAAVDSDDNRSLESFRGTARRAWQGICFAVIKANKNGGKISVVAGSGNLKSNILIVSAGR
jgi:beta-galactosidase